MKKFTGSVLTKNARNHAIVGVIRFKVHPIYEKRTKRTKHYSVHDTIGVKVGDLVEFAECRPLSKTKRWTITKIVDKKPDVENQNTKLQAKNKKERKTK